jgi:hypothetical protein
LRKVAAEAGLKMDDFSESFSQEEANKIIAALNKMKSNALEGVSKGLDKATEHTKDFKAATDAMSDAVD